MTRPVDLFREILDAQEMLMPVHGEVQSFDAETQTAQVVPLLKKKGVEAPPVKAVVGLPAGGEWDVSLHLAKGDIVLLVFTMNDLMLWLSGSDEGYELERPQMGNAVVVCVINRARARTSGTSPGVTIRKSDGTISFEMTDAGVRITGDLEVTGNVTAAALVPPVAAVGLLTHTHPDPASGNTGPPNPGS